MFKKSVKLLFNKSTSCLRENLAVKFSVKLKYIHSNLNHHTEHNIEPTTTLTLLTPLKNKDVQCKEPLPGDAGSHR